MQPLGNFSCLYSRLQQLKHIQPTFSKQVMEKLQKIIGGMILIGFFATLSVYSIKTTYVLSDIIKNPQTVLANKTASYGKFFFAKFVETIR